MCVPSSVMTGISVLGSALGMANSLSNQKEQARAQAQAQAEANRQAVQNAQIAEREARQVLADGERQKQEIRLEQQALQGKKAAEYGAGNVALASGSPLTVLGDMAREEENLVQDAGENARRKAQQYAEKAESYYQQQSSTSAQNPFSAADTVFSGLEGMGNAFSDYFSANNSQQGSSKKSANTKINPMITPLTAKGKRGANYF